MGDSQVGCADGEAIWALHRALEDAKDVVALTGAGISAESGIPVFRGPGGLWRTYSPLQLASPEAFERDPRLVWEWYDWRRQLSRKAKPNAGHIALAQLERKIIDGGARSFTLVSQNVDGLHDRAGSRNVLKLHGDLWFTRCTACGEVKRNDQTPLPELPPKCKCGGLLRPNVVWFGEPLPQDAWTQAVEATCRARVFLVIGTSATVFPAAGLAHEARQAKAKVAVINTEATELDSTAAWVLRGPAGEILPRLL